MGLVDKLRGELIDIIEWLDDSRDTMVWRFPRYENEIKMGAKLVVRESQTAVFVNEGTVADVYLPGTYTLETQNMPILSTLKGWKYGFHSPFKAEVYFVTTRQFTGLKWGTQNPIILRDAEFGMVRIRAFGGYSVRVADAGMFLKDIVGTDPQFRTEEVADTLRQMIVGRFSTALAAAHIPMLDLASNQDAIGNKLAAIMSVEFRPMGLEFPQFVIENLSLPPEVEQAMDKRTQMGVLGNLNQYTQFQAANAIEAAANNPGGAGEGVGLGMGMALGQQMAQSLGQANAAAQQQPPQQQPQGPPGMAPPPLPTAPQWYLGVGGQQVGPFDVAGLQGEAAAGRLTASTLVWRAGLPQWTAAGQVGELAGVLPQLPPPLPPQG
ncbi:MAG TPA: SPFH domain-containing protein [Mycobacteriales bacterium]|nr:SPFH domain-containing protein [Mycobacteriales bacterium]